MASTSPRSHTALPAHVGLLMRLAHQAHDAVWERWVSSSTSAVQFGALSFLADHEGASQQELGRAMDLDRSTVAAIVHRMERKDLIRRARDDQDRRRNRLMLTPLGHTTREQLMPLVIAEEQALTATLTNEEEEQLRALLQKVLVHTATLRDSRSDSETSAPAPEPER